MKYALITFLTLSINIVLSSQVFWSEDFANGIPTEWENEEFTNFGISWSYCPDTTRYGDLSNPNCPFNFNTEQNGFQRHFRSDSPENGFASCVLEPFIPQLSASLSPFQINLTTDAIDCTERENVYLSFNSHIGVNRKSASENAILNVSTDGINWTKYFPHPCLIATGTVVPGSKRWSRNSEKILIDISSVAANQEEVYIQWQWCGFDEFHWSIDDVSLSYENPSPALDLSLDSCIPYHAIMTNYKTPVSQIDSAYFLSDLVNNGNEDQENVEIVARVVDQEESKILYEQSTIIPNIETGEIIESIIFPAYFHTDGIGEYKITYTVGSLIDDANPEDNFFEYPFNITENEFQKNESTDKKVPLLLLQNDSDGNLEKDWAIANHFYIPKGDGFFADSVSFEMPSRYQEFLGGGLFIVNDPIDTRVDISLYEWNNADGNDVASENEYTKIARNELIIQGDVANQVNKIELLTPSGDAGTNIPLKNDQHYFIAFEYTHSITNRLFAISASQGLNYDPVIEVNNSMGRKRFGAMIKVGDDTFYNTFAFGGDVIPHIGFNITEDSGVSTRQVFVEDGLRVNPNPIDKAAFIDFNLAVDENAVLELRSIQGELIKQINLQTNQQQVEINCNTLPNANYLLTYKSKEVISTTKLVVLH